MRNIGLLGGTFDPPHFGHLIMAEEALCQAHLDEVWFLPSYTPPHLERKAGAIVSDPEHRIEMVKRAILGNQYFKLSLIEYERKGKSYTYDTLLALRDRFPEDAFSFIIGADMVNDLIKWYRYEDLIKMVRFIAFHRAELVPEIPAGAEIHFARMPRIDLSSSLIRKRIREHRPWRYFLPENVKTYIEENRLYE